MARSLRLLARAPSSLRRLASLSRLAIDNLRRSGAHERRRAGDAGIEAGHEALRSSLTGWEVIA